MNDKCQCWNDAVTLLLRLMLGSMFLVAGLGKLGNLAGFRAYIEKDFGGSILDGPLLTLYGYTLPFAELILGALVFVGLFTRPALALTAMMMITLFFGKFVLRDYQTAAFNAVYVLVAVYALRHSAANRFSLDGLLQNCCRRKSTTAAE